jgi:hypothetical protein
MIMGKSRTRMKRRTRIFTDLNRAGERVVVGRHSAVGMRDVGLFFRVENKNHAKARRRRGEKTTPIIVLIGEENTYQHSLTLMT